MSHKVLGTIKDHKHGFRDDMESLYYVVLYSSIRWLPHNEVACLSEEMTYYFYDWAPEGDAGIRGGIPKCANIFTGLFTNLFEWEDVATRLWMKHAWQIQHTWKNGKTIWTPERLMRVWTRTLKLDPPKENRRELKILIKGGNVSITTSAIHSVSSSACHHLAHVMSGFADATRIHELAYKPQHEAPSARATLA